MMWHLPLCMQAALFLASIVLIDTRQAWAAGSAGYTNPTTNGGSLLTRLNTTSNLGEPINVIISSHSDATILTSAGILDYFASLYYSPGDCAGISEGGVQQANLGDGNGYVTQTNVMRFNYYNGDVGSCIESVQGGNHFRYFVQNGSAADTGAFFIAASVEGDASTSHDIVANGYDLGRTLLVNNATNSSGTISPSGKRYSTSATQASLLQGVQQSSINHDISIDGQVAILTVKMVATASLTTSASGGGSASQTGSTGKTTSTGSNQTSAARLSSLTSPPLLLTGLLASLSCLFWSMI